MSPNKDEDIPHVVAEQAEGIRYGNAEWKPVGPSDAPKGESKRADGLTADEAKVRADAEFGPLGLWAGQVAAKVAALVDGGALYDYAGALDPDQIEALRKGRDLGRAVEILLATVKELRKHRHGDTDTLLVRLDWSRSVMDKIWEIGQGAPWFDRNGNAVIVADLKSLLRPAALSTAVDLLFTTLACVRAQAKKLDHERADALDRLMNIGAANEAMRSNLKALVPTHRSACYTYAGDNEHASVTRGSCVCSPAAKTARDLLGEWGNDGRTWKVASDGSEVGGAQLCDAIEQAGAALGKAQSLLVTKDAQIERMLGALRQAIQRSGEAADLMASALRKASPPEADPSALTYSYTMERWLLEKVGGWEIETRSGPKSHRAVTRTGFIGPWCASAEEALEQVARAHGWTGLAGEPKAPAADPKGKDTDFYHERPQSPQATTLPKNWFAAAEHFRACEQLGLDVARQADAFRAHFDAGSTKMSDWNGAFYRWLQAAVLLPSGGPSELARLDPAAPRTSSVGRAERDHAVDYLNRCYPDWSRLAIKNPYSGSYYLVQTHPAASMNPDRCTRVSCDPWEAVVGLAVGLGFRMAVSRGPGWRSE